MLIVVAKPIANICKKKLSNSTKRLENENDGATYPQLVYQKNPNLSLSMENTIKCHHIVFFKKNFELNFFRTDIWAFILSQQY